MLHSPANMSLLLQIRDRLREHFAACGAIISVRVPTDKDSQEIKGSQSFRGPNFPLHCTCQSSYFVV